MLPTLPTPGAPPGPARQWLPANLPQLRQRFERQDPRSLLRWGATTFGDDIALAAGFGPSGIVLMHMLVQLGLKTTVFYLQTDLLFPETLALRDRLADALGIHFHEVRPALTLEEQAIQYGQDLWRTNPDQCCSLRKVEPLRRYLAGKKAWITAIRRDQAHTRASVQILDWDHTNHLIKICPLAFWTRRQVWEYLLENKLPYNPLHDQGYPSIGCFPCTYPVGSNASERAGRWAGTGKLECGIHYQRAER